MKKKILIITMLIACSFALSACGKYSPPEPEKGSEYNRTYPKPM